MARLIEIPARWGPSSWALVDDEDAAAVEGYRWWLERRGGDGPPSVRAHIPGTRRRVYMHHVVLGSTDPVVHANGNRLDNRRANLVEGGRSAAGGTRRPTTSWHPYKGIYQRAGQDRWQARLKTGGRWLCLGTYDTAEEAARAYDAAAVEVWGRAAHLNFPGATRRP